MAFQHRDWIAERIAWAFMAMLVAAAMLGVFSVGPLSAARTADAAGTLEAEYSRFMRLNAPATLKLHVRPGTELQNGFALQLDESFVDDFSIVSVLPSPVRSVAAGKELRMEFASMDGGEAVVSFEIRPLRFGSASPQIALPRGPALRLPVFIYP
jgi:hypothetical protein